MDAGRHRPRLSVGGPRRAGRPDARRSAGRCRPLGTAGCGRRGRRDRRQRARLCGMADFPGRAGRRGAACRRELRARPGHRRDQPRPGRPCRDRRAARPQCALRRPSATALRQRQWARADISSRRGPSFSSRLPCSSRPCSRFAACRREEIDPERAHGDTPQRSADKSPVDLRSLLRKRPLLIFARLHHAVPSRQRRHASADGQRADDALEPMGDGADRRLHRRAAIVVALFSPWVGRQAQAMGTAAVLLCGLRRAADPRPAVCHGDRPYLLVAVQLLDGMTAAVFGVMVPLDHRRPHARHRTLQSGPGHRRHHDRASARRSAPRSPAT